MHWTDSRVGWNRYDRAGINLFASLAVPDFPDTGETELLWGVTGKIERFWLINTFFPFVKTWRRNNAAPIFEGIFERGLYRDGFGTSIDQSANFVWVFYKWRNQAPGQKIVAQMIAVDIIQEG